MRAELESHPQNRQWLATQDIVARHRFALSRNPQLMGTMSLAGALRPGLCVAVKRTAASR